MLFNFALPSFILQGDKYVPFIAGIAIIGISDISDIISIPVQINELNYNGSPQSPIWSSYDSSKMVMSGETSGIHGGVYITWFTPIKGYVWEDGTWNAKPINWAIHDPFSLPLVNKAKVGRAVLGRSEI